MGVLTRDAILGVSDASTELVSVPEWGGDVYVRTLSGAERDAFESSSINRDGSPNLVNYRARYAAVVICNEDGERIFTDADVVELAKRNANALDRIVEAGLRLNAMAPSDIEALEKN